MRKQIAELELLKLQIDNLDCYGLPEEAREEFDRAERCIERSLKYSYSALKLEEFEAANEEKQHE